MTQDNFTRSEIQRLAECIGEIFVHEDFDRILVLWETGIIWC